MFRLHDIEWNAERASNLWAYYASNPAYKNTYFAKHSGHRIISELLKGIMEIDTIVDIGCGPGHLLQHLSAVRGWNEYIGIDQSQEAIDAVAAIKDPEGRSIRSVLASDSSVVLGDNIADLVLCSEVIEHCMDDDLKGLFQTITRVLKPRGRVVITTPNEENLDNAKHLCPECGCVFHKWQHVRSWTCAQVADLLIANGLVPQAVYTRDFTRDDGGFTMKEKIVGRIHRGKNWRMKHVTGSSIIAFACKPN